VTLSSSSTFAAASRGEAFAAPQAMAGLMDFSGYCVDWGLTHSSRVRPLFISAALFAAALIARTCV
jgi:hypothetical protein